MDLQPLITLKLKCFSPNVKCCSVGNDYVWLRVEGMRERDRETEREREGERGGEEGRWRKGQSESEGTAWNQTGETFQWAELLSG